jgi:N-acetylglucosaminyldiphosphoundecaprenol N-acetyl-beta-D-mannosaminyltransferase
VFLYGSAPGVAARAAAVAAGRHPGLQIAGTHHGFDRDGAAVADEIRRAAPDFLFVGLGTPAQERWIARHRERLPVALAMGVGGSFDVLAGRVARAPAVWRRAGLEWLYRLGQQPRRWRRMRVLPVYLWRVALCRVTGRRRGGRRVS